VQDVTCDFDGIQRSEVQETLQTIAQFGETFTHRRERPATVLRAGWVGTHGIHAEAETLFRRQGRARLLMELTSGPGRAGV